MSRDKVRKALCLLPADGCPFAFLQDCLPVISRPKEIRADLKEAESFLHGIDIPRGKLVQEISLPTSGQGE